MKKNQVCKAREEAEKTQGGTDEKKLTLMVQFMIKSNAQNESRLETPCGRVEGMWVLLKIIKRDKRDQNLPSIAIEREPA